MMATLPPLPLPTGPSTIHDPIPSPPSSPTSPILPADPTTKKEREPPSMFEFTKRKAWAHLLLSQLQGSMLLVFSPGAKVIYCAGEVRELLGWEFGDVVDKSLVQLLHDDDVQPFFAHMHHSIATKSELAAYARLRANSDRTPLFEIRGHPHFALPEDLDGSLLNSNGLSDLDQVIGINGELLRANGEREGSGGEGEGTDAERREREESRKKYMCFFAMLRPYPSKPTALLDSFLDLKIENEHLRQRLHHIVTSKDSPSPPLATTSSDLLRALHAKDPAAAALLLSSHSHPSTAGKHPFPGSELDDAAVARQRKKSKKSAGGGGAGAPPGGDARAYVCVTCGRTDSPEWRKGPLGAKTLCNACGLRWAKSRNPRKIAGALGGTDNPLSLVTPSLDPMPTNPSVANPLPSGPGDAGEKTPLSSVPDYGGGSWPDAMPQIN